MSKNPYYGFTVPVLLGFTVRDVPAALRLNARFGERPVLIGPHATVLGGILRARCAFRLPSGPSGEIRDEILTELLLSLPVSYTETRVLLIPFSPQAKEYVRRNRTVLSSLMLFADPEAVFQTGKENAS